MAAVTFEVYIDERSRWRWRLKSPNGRIVAEAGEGYASRLDCLGAIHFVRDSTDAQIQYVDQARILMARTRPEPSSELSALGTMVSGHDPARARQQPDAVAAELKRRLARPEPARRPAAPDEARR
jgi:uncharacterized protein